MSECKRDMSELKKHAEELGFILVKYRGMWGLVEKKDVEKLLGQVRNG